MPEFISLKDERHISNYSCDAPVSNVTRKLVSGTFDIHPPPKLECQLT